MAHEISYTFIPVNMCEFIIKFNKVIANKKYIFLAVFSVINAVMRVTKKENLIGRLG